MLEQLLFSFCSTKIDDMKPVHDFLSESTVHSFAHLTGERRPYVKIIWAVAFLVSVTYCSMRIAELCAKYTRAEVSTTVKADSVNFEFPDVYICSENPISGSYSEKLNENDTKLLRQYRALSNASLSWMNASQENNLYIHSYAARIIHSLPYQFLSDKLGHNWLKQNTIFNTTDSIATIFYHPTQINCLKMNWSTDVHIELKSVSEALILLLFLDPQLPPQFETGEPDFQFHRGEKINLRPFEWDFFYGVNFVRSSGARIYFVPKGHYPSDLDVHTVLGPGSQHKLVLKMQDVSYDESNFAGQCKASDSETVQFVNPYSGAMDTYKYSKGACWYREIARMSQEKFNCTTWPIPLSLEYRNLGSCFNMSSVSGRNKLQLETKLYTDRSNISSMARQRCEMLKPCKSRQYSYQYSLSNWPTDEMYDKFVLKRINAHYINYARVDVPGLEFLIKNSTNKQTKASLLQILFSSEELLSSQSELSKSYVFSALIADIGGLLGLFLGASFLSVLELVELLHNLVLVITGKRKKIHAVDAPSVQ